ncbi:MAG: NAD(P)H-binding protein [Bacteroidales bacterium]|nr:NAD(P)H-binding protein [Bacteroidales bacterium]MBN2761627.1 NAD(P)H-binding protein [Bacteroidales bacterium]
MKILLLGATGRTGKQIIEEALKRGHNISAIARNPEKLNDYNIEITQGTPYDYETVEKAIAGCDAVINTLNVSRKSDNPWASLAAPKDLISKSAYNAVKAMERAGVKRFVALGAIGAGHSWKASPWILKLIVTMSNLKYAFRDHGKQEEILENSAVDYTICRAPMLSDKKSDSGAFATPEASRPAGTTLCRNSAAEFFITIIEKNMFLRQTISLANKSA